MITNIYKALEARNAAKDKSEALRMSSLGEKCTRKLWYRQHKPETAEPLAGNVLMTFLHGDTIEREVLALLREGGSKVEGEQDELDLFGVKGHRDAIIDGLLVDVKTANSRGMEKFKQHRLESDDPFGYMDQLSAYHEASKEDPRVTNKTEAAFLVVDKELGHVVLDKYTIKPKPWESIIAKTRQLLGKAEPPPRAYTDEPDGKSGNRVIPLPCRYCQFKQECWKESNGGRGLRKFWFSVGPRWFTRVKKEPRENVKEEQKESKHLR